MRDGGNVFDHGDLETCGLQSADSRLTTLTGTLDKDLNALHAVLHRSLSGCLCSALSSEGSGLTGTAEAELACGRPRDSVALCVGYSNDSVIKGRLDMRRAFFDVLSLTAAADRSLLTCFDCQLIALLTSSC